MGTKKKPEQLSRNWGLPTRRTQGRRLRPYRKRGATKGSVRAVDAERAELAGRPDAQNQDEEMRTRADLCTDGKDWLRTQCVPASGNGSGEGETARRLARSKAQGKASRIRRMKQRHRVFKEWEQYAGTRRA